MSLANNIRYLRKKQGWSQDFLAEQLGYKSYTTIQKWESGVSEPPLKKAHAIAELFHVDIDDLTKNDFERSDNAPHEIPPGFDPLPPVSTVPIVGSIACGVPITAEQNIEGYATVPERWKADFVLICKGDSMEPKIKNGDVVAIRKQSAVENGQIAAVLINDEATLKKVYQYPERLELRPLNPDYESIVLYADEMNSAVIEGRAVGICRDI